jgi:IS30 family transposase
MTVVRGTSVREAFTRRLVDTPSSLRLSFTYDQGKEMTLGTRKITLKQSAYSIRIRYEYLTI